MYKADAGQFHTYATDSLEDNHANQSVADDCSAPSTDSVADIMAKFANGRKSIPTADVAITGDLESLETIRPELFESGALPPVLVTPGRTTAWQRLQSPGSPESLIRSLGYMPLAHDAKVRVFVQREDFWRVSRKGLLAVPVGKQGLTTFRRLLDAFPEQYFDVLAFQYDDSSLDSRDSQRVHCVRERGMHTHFFKQYLTPTFCERYDFVFPWMDDLEPQFFDPREFIEIMLRNNLELAQPALGRGSIVSHEITRARTDLAVGRRTNFVELMAQVFTSEAWVRYWRILRDDSAVNPYGWGYDFVCGRAAQIPMMGIVDSMPILHTRGFAQGRPDSRRVRALLDRSSTRIQRDWGYGLLDPFVPKELGSLA